MSLVLFELNWIEELLLLQILNWFAVVIYNEKAAFVNRWAEVCKLSVSLSYFLNTSYVFLSYMMSFDDYDYYYYFTLLVSSGHGSSWNSIKWVNTGNAPRRRPIREREKAFLSIIQKLSCYFSNFDTVFSPLVTPTPSCAHCQKEGYKVL